MREQCESPGVKGEGESEDEGEMKLVEEDVFGFPLGGGKPNGEKD